MATTLERLLLVEEEDDFAALRGETADVDDARSGDFDGDVDLLMALDGVERDDVFLTN